MPVTLQVSVAPQEGRRQQLGNISKMCMAYS